MKTEKSFTKKEVDKNILGFVNLVKNFTYTELYEILRKSDGSLVYTADGKNYFVGRYIISQNSTGWQVTTHLGDVENEFQSKTAAIFYSMSLMKTKLKLADQLVKQDYAVLVNKNQMDLYKQKLNSVLKTGDQFKSELYAAKHTFSQHKYIIAKEELEKTLNLAKYLKLGT